MEVSEDKQSLCYDKYPASQLSQSVMNMGLADNITSSALFEYVASSKGFIIY